MGRLRNLSQSLKAAAFANIGSSSSPTTSDGAATPVEGPSLKQPPAMTREASSTSTLVQPTGTPNRRTVSDSRTMSYYDPPTMGLNREDNIEELRPVFSFLNSHQNKLYQEGYFLKLNDLDTNGKPNADRNWTECFGQLVGTVLSLWDAAALDAAGQDGEVSPTFINLADASIKMIETLPTRNANVQPLQNVLSVSTAGKNRYLLHFNSLHSLTQWTAGIRLAMFEHSSLHELYTGSLIAGKGKNLNNIKSIMERQRFREEDWCRVRFGAGTPWRRCWFTIDPPDEKEWQKVNKQLKKKSPYERASYPKGDLKFFDTKKTKKATPIATISDVYAAYAVYPESKPLIDQSTLVKLEGKITIHSKPESKTEGFVFVMPEVHPAVSGFEILLRFLFPVYDTFGLYGRPNRLVADKLDARGLMFAMPKDRRYGYLDIIDVASLIHSDGSDKWTEREWRKRTKELVSRRIAGTIPARPSGSSEQPRRSLGSRPAVRFGGDSPVEDAEIPHQSTDAVFKVPKKIHTAPLAAQSTPSFQKHVRSVSETLSSISPSKRKQARDLMPSKLASTEQETIHDIDVAPPPPPPAHRSVQPAETSPGNGVMKSTNSSDSDLEHPRLDPQDVTRDLPVMTPPTPVGQPTFNHQANDQPMRRPRDRPDLRREKSRMSSATLSQLADANRGVKGIAQAGGTAAAGAAATAAWSQSGRHEDHGRGVNAITHPDDISSQANPAHAAIIEHYAEDQEGVSEYNPASRPTSQYSINRKPLPYPPSFVTPTESLHSDQSRNKMEDPALFPVFSEMHLPKSLPDDNVRRAGGVRKTVGDPHYDQSKRKDILDIDFGVTRSLSPVNGRPNSGGRMTPHQTSRNVSPARTPQEGKSPPYGRVSPVSDSSRPASFLWQPGSQPGGRLSPQALTPEQFVQQRAMAARNAYGYSPQRKSSPLQVEEQRSSPAVSPSPKRLQKKGNSRPGSADAQGRLSRSANRLSQNLSNFMNGPLTSLSERTRGPESSNELGGPLRTQEPEQQNGYKLIGDALYSRRQPPQGPPHGHNPRHVQPQSIDNNLSNQQMHYHQQQHPPPPPPQSGYPSQEFPSRQVYIDRGNARGGQQ